jgi:hypothetical protein
MLTICSKNHVVLFNGQRMTGEEKLTPEQERQHGQLLFQLLDNPPEKVKLG